MLYILSGADDYSLRRRLDQLKSQWDDGESLAINTTLFEAQQLAVNDVLNACQSAPFLGKHRLVIVEGLLARFESKEGGRRTPIGEWQPLVDYASAMSPTAIIVLVDGKASKNNPLLKKLTPLAQVEEFPPMKGARLHQWIHSRVAEHGAKISPQAVKYLNESAGDNLWLLANEIEKLSLYAQGRPIQEADVREVTSLTREANVFAMVDAIVEKRANTAMQLLHKLLAEGMTPQHVLFMLTRQLRLMVQARHLDAPGLSLSQKQRQLGLSPNYPMDRLLRQSAKYSIPRLVNIYRNVLETDLAIKTGKWKDRIALDLLVAQVCS